MKKNMKLILTLSSCWLGGCVSYPGTLVLPVQFENQNKAPLMQAPQRHTDLTRHVTPGKIIKSKIEPISEDLTVNQLKIKQLLLEIELLTLENQRIQQKLQYRKKYRSKQKPLQTPIFFANEKLDIDIKNFHQRVSLAYTQLNHRPTVDLNNFTNPIPLTQSDVDNDVVPVANTLTLVQKKPSLYHAVYVFMNKKQWQQTWQNLHDHKVSDKWRGYNKATAVYFIYVGAYGQKKYASRRQLNLAKLVGLEPKIVVNNDQRRLISLLSI